MKVRRVHLLALRQRRGRKGLSLRALARRANVSVSAVADVVHGRSFESLVLGDLLECVGASRSVDQLTLDVRLIESAWAVVEGSEPNEMESAVRALELCRLDPAGMAKFLDSWD
ncbi:MAG: helix-turn-helix domain-containing protein, partial [Mycobacterium sp.]